MKKEGFIKSFLKSYLLKRKDKRIKRQYLKETDRGYVKFCYYCLDKKKDTSVNRVEKVESFNPATRMFAFRGICFDCWKKREKL